MKNRFKFALVSFLALCFYACIDLDSIKDYTLERELKETDEYVRSMLANNENVDTTASGIFYVRLKEGTGPFPEAGDTLSVKYVGYLMNNTIFDTSLFNQPDSTYTYVYKESDVIQGWETMMGMMNKGCKMKFVLPSSLAYGSQGAIGIPPYSALIFVAVMHDIRKRN